MAIAPRIEEFLASRGSRYDLVAHPRSRTSIGTADAAGIPGDRLVKGVLLEDDEGLVLAVLPSTLSVHIGHLTTLTHRRFRLADEGDLPRAFPDCVAGAIPPVGAAYGLRTLVEGSLGRGGDVYFEAGDHEHLVHMGAEAFMALLEPAGRIDFGKPERHLEGGAPRDDVTSSRRAPG